MRKGEIIATLRAHEADLRRQGVAHAALFGSHARDDACLESDIDIVIDPDARLSIFDYVGVREYIAGLFDTPVDVVNRGGLKPYVRPDVLTDVHYAF